MNANYVSSFLHLDLNDDGVEDDIQSLVCNFLPQDLIKQIESVQRLEGHFGCGYYHSKFSGCMKNMMASLTGTTQTWWNARYLIIFHKVLTGHLHIHHCTLTHKH